MKENDATRVMPRVADETQQAPATSEVPAGAATPAPAVAPTPPATPAPDITTMMPSQGFAYTIEPQPTRPVATQTVPDLTGFDVGMGIEEPTPVAVPTAAPAAVVAAAPVATPVAAPVASAPAAAPTATSAAAPVSTTPAASAEPVAAAPAAAPQPEQAEQAEAVKKPEPPREPEEERPRFRRIEPRPDEVAPKPAPEPAPAPAAAAAAPAAAASQPSSAPASPQAGALRVSTWAIAALAVSAAALIACWMPLINNGAFLAGIVGAILAVVALVGVVRGKATGRGLAIAALVIGVLAASLVPIFQQMSPPNPTAFFNRGSAPAATASSSMASDVFNLAPGQSIDLDNGMTVVLSGVRTGLSNYDGSPIVGVSVSYLNRSDQSLDFSIYDWKGENAAGEQSSETIYNEAQNRLSTGKLAPNGSVMGNIYFKGDTVRVHYYSDVVNQQSPTATWTLS